MERGVPATAYHSGQPERDRRKAAADWKENKCLVVSVVVFATSISSLH